MQVPDGFICCSIDFVFCTEDLMVSEESEDGPGNLTAADLVEESHQSGGETTDTDTDGLDRDPDLLSDIEQQEGATVPQEPTVNQHQIATKKQQGTVPQMSTLRDQFHCALALRHVIQSVRSKPLPWPPKAKDLSHDTAEKIVPEKLFNFIAWMVGMSDEPEEEKRLKLTAGESRRVLNIAQDMIYLASKGRKPMPKHVSLGMAVRHLSRSAQLIGLL